MRPRSSRCLPWSPIVGFALLNEHPMDSAGCWPVYHLLDRVPGNDQHSRCDRDYAIYRHRPAFHQCGRLVVGDLPGWRGDYAKYLTFFWHRVLRRQREVWCRLLGVG